jgi:glutamyl/glutaminyl-tRNA synthetase
MPYTGRLAPSPTGLLHLGHARTFWRAYERARTANGTLWLRDEDLDPHRSHVEFSTAMKDDLHWLGITWDAEEKQRDRLALYRDAMQQLLADGHIYPCTCSRRDLYNSTQAPHEDDDEPIYPGTCRPKTNVSSELELLATNLSSRPERSAVERPVVRTTEALPTLPTNYRFRAPTGEAITFTDLHAGPQSFRAGADFGDFLVWRKDGLPSYQLACVVDDAAMGITEVVRGRDLLKSTARQILLQRALGLTTPAYFHCDLMRDETGARLAKRHDALSLRALRQSGLSPAGVLTRFS